jgi:5,10-methenyltetrahydrofolate synthetase
MTSTPPGPGAPKDEWRPWSATVDRAAQSTEVCAGLLAWPPLHGVVATYLAMDGEIDLSPLSAEPRCRILVPRTERGNRLSLHDLDEHALVVHRFGFREPDRASSAVPLDDVDVVLVPGLVFDRRGFRIGHGAGMYDRLLADLPVGVVRVGVTVEALVVDRLPAEDFDRPVDWLATEVGVSRVGDPLPASAAAVAASACELGIAAAMVRFPEGTKTSRDAAAAVGSELGAIAKSLVFLVDDQPILVICSGDRRVDERRLAALLGAEQAAPAPLDTVRAVTGYVAGGTPAIGHAQPLEVIADASLARYRWVWSAGGTPDTVYPVALERLIAATGARWADVSSRG